MAKDWIINTLSDGIVVLSTSGEVVEVNSSAEFYLTNCIQDFHVRGCERNKQKKKQQYRDYTIFIENQPLWHEALQMRKNGLIEIELQGVFRLKTFYQIDIHDFFDGKNHYSGCVSMIRDITQIKMEKMLLEKQVEVDHLTHVLNKKFYIELQ